MKGKHCKCKGITKGNPGKLIFMGVSDSHRGVISDEAMKKMLDNNDPSKRWVIHPPDKNVVSTDTIEDGCFQGTISRPCVAYVSMEDTEESKKHREKIIDNMMKNARFMTIDELIRKGRNHFK